MPYTLISRDEIPDARGTGTLYEHNETGARVFHIANDDVENVFAYAFPTLPSDSTGIAHILEHTVLSGSERYPLKDPFLHLMTGSVHTYLNAWTYPDRTVYPAASPVAQDLFNLMKVYGDAVFFPLLKRELFRQEGHRLQFSPEGTLERSGVVLNEMKGNYASHDSIAAERSIQSLFPDTLYRYDSGGDPGVIPDLTYEKFTAFHRDWYHPSQVKIFLYGNVPTEEYLSFLEGEFFSRFDRREREATIPMQPRWSAPRTSHSFYPIPAGADTANGTSITVNWLLFPVVESDRLLRMSALTEMLVGNSGAPLYKALLDSGLGQDVSPIFGLDGDLQEAVFSAGLRGSEPDRSEQVEAVIESTLRRIVRDGFDDDLREGALRRFEFRNRELKSGPNGLRLLGRTLRSWMYGGEPAAGLHLSQRIADMRGELESNPRLFEEMVEEFLLDNRHRSTVIVEPAPGLAEDREAEEAAELAGYLSEMDEETRATVEREQRELETMQETEDDPEAVAAIPYLTLDDVPGEISTITHAADLWDDVPVYRHELGTNGILYADFAFDLQGVPDEWIDLLDIFASAFTEVGMPGVPHEEVQRRINMRTGGISTMLSNQYRSDDPSRILRLFTVRVKLLERQLGEGFSLFEDILRTVDFSDTERLGQVVDEVYSELKAALIPSGHYFSGVRVASQLSPLAAIEDRVGGIGQYLFLTDRPDLDSFSRRLGEMARTILNPGRLYVNLTADAGAMKPLADRARAAAEALRAVRSDGGSVERFRGETFTATLAGSGPEFLRSSSGVSYVAQALRGRRFLEPGYAAQEVLAHMLKTGPLWEKIRMAGGAYGAFCSSKSLEGLFTFGSYRDPHTVRTVNAYREALEEFGAAAPAARDVELSLISLLGRELKPMVPREKGFIDFKRRLYGVSDDLRQRVRDDLRSVTGEDIATAATALQERLAQAALAILGGSSSHDEATEAFPGLRVTDLGV